MHASIVNASQVGVRSSAIGEDSPELSAAGQLETFLGVSGVDDVSVGVTIHHLITDVLKTEE